MYVEENPLRRARLACGMRLSELAMRTALSPSILQKIDAGRFAELPGGVYARSYIRAVAGVVGLDPDEAVQQLAPRLPPAEDPLPVLRELAKYDDPAWLLELSRIGNLLKGLLGKRREANPIGRRAIAAGVDAVLLLLQLAVVAQVTAWTCGVATTTLLTTHGGALLPLFVVQIVLYFVVLGGIGGRTPGGFVSRLPVGTGDTPLAPHAVLQRSLR